MILALAALTVMALAPATALGAKGGTDRPAKAAFSGTTVVTPTGLVRVAGYFVGHGVRGEALSLALQSVNRSRCKPPLTEKEVEKIVNSANKWRKPPPWVIDPLTYVEDPRLDTKAHLLLMTLAHRADADGMVRGGKWLQQATPLHRNSISQAVSDLEELGRIEVERKGRAANLYRLLMPPRSSKSAQQVCIKGSDLACGKGE